MYGNEIAVHLRRQIFKRKRLDDFVDASCTCFAFGPILIDLCLSLALFVPR